MSIHLSRRCAAVAAAATLALGLTACSGDKDDAAANSAAAQSDIDVALSELNAPDNDGHGAGSKADSAEPGTPQITADRTVDLTDGDTVKVAVRNLDTSAGYYLAICKAGTGADAAGHGVPPDCTGDRESATWITPEGSDQGTAHTDSDGTAEASLTVKTTGEAVNCATDKCVLKVFGDDDNSSRNVGEAPVSFA